MPAGDGEPPPGIADNNADCDDTNPNTFPGAAENDDPRACMNDDDDDGWGDDGNGDNPLPPGVEPGTDCDDANLDTFPGAAENENQPDQCMNDADGDGWGDANPGDGDNPTSGSDCDDENPQLNPATLQLTAFLPYIGNDTAPGRIMTVNVTDASLTEFVELENVMGMIPNVDISSAALNKDMEIYANDLESVRLHTVDYAKNCSRQEGIVSPVGTMAYGPSGDIVCGLEFGSDQVLYGIGQIGETLRVFDLETGEYTHFPLTLNDSLIEIAACGMARDCAEDRLLVADGQNRTIYSVATNGELTEVRNLSKEITAEWNPTGLEYDPVSRTVLLSTGSELWRVDINDDDVPAELIGMFAEDVSNLQWLPICM